MKRFQDRFPSLWHVTDRTALDGIRQHGLLSARALCALHGVASDDRLRHNRNGWMQAGPAMLRTQGLREQALARRLPAGVSPADWRWFINSLVFLFPTVAGVRRLLGSEPGRDQVVLGYDTKALIAHAPLLACRYNNGYIDRSPRSAPRLRRPSDYQPAEIWTAGPVAEVAVPDRIPPHIRFELLPPG